MGIIAILTIILNILAGQAADGGINRNQPIYRMADGVLCPAKSDLRVFEDASYICQRADGTRVKVRIYIDNNR